MNTRYTKVAIILHWLIALMIFGMLALGWYMSGLPKDAPKVMSLDLFNWHMHTVQFTEATSPRSYYFNLHKSFGLTVFALILLRICWRFTHVAPPLPATMVAWQQKAAKASHHLLYLLMFLMPLSGLIMGAYSKYGVKWFGTSVIAGLDNEPMRSLFKEVHETIAWLILALVVIHVLAALKHMLIDKDDVMSHMSLSK
ncbi:MAG TPA: cytochrome b [Methylophilaceae bacterium]|jgi:cytochrome b561